MNETIQNINPKFADLSKNFEAFKNLDALLTAFSQVRPLECVRLLLIAVDPLIQTYGTKHDFCRYIWGL